MKTQHVIILLWLGVMLGLPLIAPAQTFLPPVGAVWTFEITHIGGPPYLAFMQAKQDTFIMGRSCREISWVEASPIPTYSKTYWAVSGDSILRYQSADSSFHLLYDFSARVGDTLEVWVPYSSRSLSSPDSHRLVITSVDTIGWQNQSRRVYWTNAIDVPPESDGWVFAGSAMVEGIGSLRNLVPEYELSESFSALKQFREPGLCLTILPGEENLQGGDPSQFQDESTCSLILSLEKNIQTLGIYPNTTPGPFTLELPDSWPPDAVALSLLDLQGQVVFRQQLVFRPGEPLRVEAEGLPPGLYLLRVRRGQSQVVWGKLRVGR